MDSMCTNGVRRAMDVIDRCRLLTMFGYVCMMSCNIYPARTSMVFNGRGVGVWDPIFLQNRFPRAQMALMWVKTSFTRSGLKRVRKLFCGAGQKGQIVKMSRPWN